MILLDLEQGSDEWKALRKTKVGASDASTILGINPYCNARKLWGIKVGLLEDQEETPAMTRGKELEPVARDKFCFQMGMVYKPIVGLSETYDWMLASLDGLSEDNQSLVEIKCNGVKANEYVMKGEIPPWHIPQLAHQLIVTGLNKAYYYSFDGNNGLILEYQRDEEYNKRLIEKELAFWKNVCTFSPPE